MYREVRASDNCYQREKSRARLSLFHIHPLPPFHLCLSSAVATIKVHIPEHFLYLDMSEDLLIFDFSNFTSDYIHEKCKSIFNCVILI